MLKKLSDEIRLCYEHAYSCAQKARDAISEEIRADFLRLEQGWLKLGQSYQFGARLNDFLTLQRERLRPGVSPAKTAPFFHEGQMFLPPIRCETCGGEAYLIRRSPDPERPGCERRSFECRACGHKPQISVPE